MVAQTDYCIEGEGMVVQTDKSKFRKRKAAANGRGLRVEGTWVGKTFENKKNCTAKTLLP
jgi:hypothetical protein